MPWLETDPVTERKRFVVEAQGGLFSHTELCRRHNISRRTGYKWLAPFLPMYMRHGTLEELK